MKKMVLSKRKIVLASSVAVLAVLAALVIGLSAYYSSHALPHTSIAGQPVGGMTRQQITEEIQERIDTGKISLDGEIEPVEVALGDAGVHVDVEQTVDEAFAPNRGFVTRLTGLFSERDVTPVVSVDESQLEEFVGTLAGDGIRPVRNGAVTFDEGQQIFVAEEAEMGSTVDAATLSNEITSSIQAMTFAPIAVSVIEVSPDHDSEAAKAAADRANQWLATEVSLVDADEVAHTAEVSDKAQWVKFESSKDGLTASLDKAEVQKWVDEHSAESNLEPEPKIENVNSKGKVLSVSVEGVDGRTAVNGNALADAIVASFDGGEPFVGTIEYETAARPVDQRLIADGAENMVYAAAPGEKWIDINLSNFTVTGYEGATPVMQSPMVPGAPATPTVTGEYSVWAKVPIQTMRGNNVDGTTYETPNVPWILYFHGGYATHGAYWRSSFGYDAGPAGSHGCVNMPVGQARELYDWAEVGTKVVSHY